MQSGGLREFVADAGERIVCRDVVDGRFPECIPAMQDLHAVAFPEHPFARFAIADDAQRASRREALFVHQWYVTVDERPAGILLFDSNCVRRVAPLHFITVDEDLRDVRVDGLRLGDWSMNLMLQTVVGEGADLGCVAETPPYTLKIFLKSGWTEIGRGYLEPVHGWDWPHLGLETRGLSLAWKAPTDLGSGVDPDDIARRAAAAFLLDMYLVPSDLDWVIELTGDQRFVPGPRRR